MDQEKAINRILRDMKMQGLISEEANGEVKMYLNAVWVAAWEERAKVFALKAKPVGQYDRHGKLLNTFKSQKEAGQKTGHPTDSINKALQRGNITRQGWTWKYL